MRWVANTHTTDVNRIIRELSAGHDGMRQLVEGLPKESDAIPIGKMVSEDMFGIYEVVPCKCAFCTEIRRYAALDAWKRMNKQIIAEKEGQ